MSFLRSRAEQLADHLRACIARGEIVQPLPNIRAWSLQLGVGHGTLELALQLLRRKGLVRIRPRKGVHLLRATGSLKSSQHPPVVRWIAYGRDHPDISVQREFFGAILEKLSAHEIRFSVEMCNAIRLGNIHQRGTRAHERLMLISLPGKFQEMFADFRKNALIIGLPFPGVQLPFISTDVFSAVRHATHNLAQQGFTRISLVIKEGSRQPMVEHFRKICAEAPYPIQGDVVRMTDELRGQNVAAQRLAARITGRHGFVTIYPIPASVLMTAFMKKDIKVPEQVEVVAVNTTLQAIRTVPLPTYYPYPVEAFSKAVCQAAVHYFEQGSLPPLRKMIPLKLLSPKVI